MAETPETDISSTRIFALLNISADDMYASQGRASAVINFPSFAEQLSQVQNMVVSKADSDMDVSSVYIMAVVRGRVQNPVVRAWTFTLDGHDFYVLRLGDEDTLVYDATTDQWVDWDSIQSGAWRPNTGTTWTDSQALAHTQGSSIIAGDDTFGILWFLDPDLPYDQAPDVTRGTQQYPFVRVVTGQVVMRGRDVTPCFAIFVDGDNYGLTATEFTPGVKLEASDDQGRTFVDYGTVTTPNSRVPGTFEWLSLGQVQTPGRIFRITDNGVFARIDTMEMEDGQ